MSKKSSAKIMLLAAAILGAVVWFLPSILRGIWYVLWLFTPFIIAYIISLIINPMADGLQKRFKLPRGVSAILVIVLTVGVIGGIATAIIWKIVDEIRGLYEDFPMIYVQIRTTWYSITDTLSRLSQNLPDGIANITDGFSERVMSWISELAENTNVVHTAGNVAKRLPSLFISIIVFIISLYFMVKDADIVSRKIKSFFTDTALGHINNLKSEIKRYIGAYVKAQLIIMCISFVILIIGFSVLKVKYALIIALATAIVDALPFFGSGAVLWPWSVVSFVIGDPRKGVGLLIIYLVVILMRQFVEPKIVSRNIGMHPILTLISMYIGYRVFSIGGMIFGPLVMMSIISLVKIGIFNDVIKAIKNISLMIKKEIKNIKISIENEGE